MNTLVKCLGVGLLLLLHSLISAAEVVNSTHSDIQNRLILVQGTILNAYFDGKYQEIKRAKPFYGYGWLDDHRVFIAYQHEGWAEASAMLEVLDLLQNKTYSLGEIGGTGESHFAVNSKTKEVVFNTEDGIYLMTINISKLADFKTSHQTRIISKTPADADQTFGWSVFWIDDKTIGYLDALRNRLVRISVPR